MRLSIRAAAVIAGLLVTLSASGAKAGWYGFNGGAYSIGSVKGYGYVVYSGESYLWFQHYYCTGTNNQNGTCSVPLSAYYWAIPVSSPAFPVFSAAVVASFMNNTPSQTNPKSTMQVGCDSCASFTATPPGMGGTWQFWVPEGVTLWPRLN